MTIIDSVKKGNSVLSFYRKHLAHAKNALFLGLFVGFFCPRVLAEEGHILYKLVGEWEGEVYLFPLLPMDQMFHTAIPVEEIFQKAKVLSENGKDETFQDPDRSQFLKLFDMKNYQMSPHSTAKNYYLDVVLDEQGNMKVKVKKVLRQPDGTHNRQAGNELNVLEKISEKQITMTPTVNKAPGHICTQIGKEVLFRRDASGSSIFLFHANQYNVAALVKQKDGTRSLILGAYTKVKELKTDIKIFDKYGTGTKVKIFTGPEPWKKTEPFKIGEYIGMRGSGFILFDEEKNPEKEAEVLPDGYESCDDISHTPHDGKKYAEKALNPIFLFEDGTTISGAKCYWDLVQK